MRVIKFRATNRNTGEWHYGDLVHINAQRCIIQEKVNRGRDNEFIGHPCTTETISQYTGLKDKNGKEIYEGDILRVRVLVQGYDFSNEFWRVGFIKFVSGKFALVNCTNYATSDLTIKHDFSPCKTAQCTYPKYRSEIIGNIHDNPELLKGE